MECTTTIKATMTGPESVAVHTLLSKLNANSDIFRYICDGKTREILYSVHRCLDGALWGDDRDVK